MLDTNVRPFHREQTHGILDRSAGRTYGSSEALGWTSLFVSEQLEKPFLAEVPATRAHLIVMHLGGPVTVHGAVGGREVRKKVDPGGLFLWPAGQTFRVELEGAVDTLHLYVRQSVVDDVAQAFIEGGKDVSIEPLLGEHDEVIGQLALEAAAAAQSGETGTLLIDQLSRLIAGRMLRRSGASGRASLLAGPFDPRAIEPVRAFIEDTLDQRHSLEEMSAIAGLSVTHFTRQFRRATGVSPHQYVLRRRVERARHLLLWTHAPIAEIADICGFSHQEHLTGIFRRQTGETPARYRRLRHR